MRGPASSTLCGGGRTVAYEQRRPSRRAGPPGKRMLLADRPAVCTPSALCRTPAPPPSELQFAGPAYAAARRTPRA